MRAHVVLLTVSAIFGGCGTAAKPDAGHGSFIGAPPITHEKQMVEDATRQLVSLYPPASTRLVFAHAVADTFGNQLVEKLRSQGYALREQTAQAPAPAEPETADQTKEVAGTSFGYVLDAVGSTRLYRVTLNVGRQTISRAYVAQDDLVHPAGAWVRKE